MLSQSGVTQIPRSHETSEALPLVDKINGRTRATEQKALKDKKYKTLKTKQIYSEATKSRSSWKRSSHL
jgi:hypothetical protein